MSALYYEPCHNEMWVEITQSVYTDLLVAGRSGDRIRVGVRFATPVQSGPRAHAASCTMGARVSFPGVKRPGHGIDHLRSEQDPYSLSDPYGLLQGELVIIIHCGAEVLLHAFLNSALIIDSIISNVMQYT